MEMRIAIVTRGQILGFNDIIKQKNHTATLKCITNTGSLYAVNAQEFLFKIQRDKSTWLEMVDYFNSKDKQTKSKIKDSAANLGKFKKGKILHQQ